MKYLMIVGMLILIAHLTAQSMRLVGEQIREQEYADFIEREKSGKGFSEQSARWIW